MTISDQLSAISEHRCAFATLVHKLTDEDRLAVTDFVSRIMEARRLGVAGSPYSASRLRHVLISNGQMVSINVVRDHLNGRCRCGKTS